MSVKTGWLPSSALKEKASDSTAWAEIGRKHLRTYIQIHASHCMVSGAESSGVMYCWHAMLDRTLTNLITICVAAVGKH